MYIDRSKVKSIINNIINYPTVCLTVDGKQIEVPCYERNVEYKSAPEYTQTEEFIKACNRVGNISPNLVQRAVFGSNGMMKVYFSGKTIMSSFSRMNSRLLESATVEIARGNEEPFEGILSGMLTNKMSNVEILEIDSQLATLAFGNIKALLSSSNNSYVEFINSKEIGKKLFGEEARLTEIFPRLGGIGIAGRLAGARVLKGNWEHMPNSNDMRCDRWTVQEGIYEADKVLYRFVSDYMKNYYRE